MHEDPELWPDLPYAAWSDTAATLHLWTQVVGKIRLSLTPWVNHGWQVPLYVSARGLTTSPIPYAGELLELEFDFLAQQLRACTSTGHDASLALQPQPVAAFYAQVMSLMAQLGVAVTINEL